MGAEVEIGSVTRYPYPLSLLRRNHLSEDKDMSREYRDING